MRMSSVLEKIAALSLCKIYGSKSNVGVGCRKARKSDTVHLPEVFPYGQVFPEASPNEYDQDFDRDTNK